MKKSILKSRFFWLTILIFVIFWTIFYFLFFSPLFQIKEIIISGNARVSIEEVENIVEMNLEKKILFFPTTSIFLINLNKIREEILNIHPQIFEIKINREFPNVLNLILRERVALAYFCQKLPPSSIVNEEGFKEKCFLLANDGIIFEEYEMRGGLIKIIDGQDENFFKLGEKVIEKDYLEKILKIQKNISEDLKIEIEEFIVFSERLNVKTADNWEIYFDPKGDLNWQLTKLKLVLEEKIPPERRRDLEYIELRFGDLATFKYR